MKRRGKINCGNRGSVTIFLTLLLVVMLVLLSAVTGAVRFKCARAKAAAALSAAMSGIKADFNPYIFEEYHLLLFDKTYYGKGDGKTEQLIEESLSENLGSEYEVKKVIMSGVNTMLTNDCAAFGNQIMDHMKYYLIENAAEELVEKLGGNPEEVDTALDDNDKIRMNSDIADGLDKTDGKGEEAEYVKKSEEEYYEQHPEEKDENKKEKDDPRMSTRTVGGLFMAALICPDDVTFSENMLDFMDIPSGKKALSTWFSDEEIDTSFTDYGALSGSLTAMDGWGSRFNDYIAVIAYCNDVFKCLKDQWDKETYLNMEREYLIFGELRDAENYVGTVKKLIKLRLGLNFAYILTDSSKMARVSALATSLTAWAPYLQPIVKYLLAGCWAYVESCADVKFLVEGKKVPLIKNSEDWVTDLYGIKDIATVEKEDDDKGLDYEEYLMILMAMEGDRLYYRMADLIEMNTRMRYPDFRMENAAVEFAVDVSIEFDGRLIELYREDGY